MNVASPDPLTGEITGSASSPVNSTAIRTLNGGLVAVLRAGSRLYELTHRRGNLPDDFGRGRSTPTEIRAAGDGAISAIGDPDLALAAHRTQLDLAVPVRDGLALLTKAANTTST
jgi:hypothetical protein